MSTITGTSGDDTLVGTPGADTADLLGGNDSFTGLGGADTVDGGAGNDTVTGDGGSDSLSGGSGSDSISGGNGSDTVLGGSGSDANLSGDGGDDFIDGGGGDDSIDGGAGDDCVTGGSGNDTILGGFGNDPELSGDVGNDLINGGTGQDTLSGGAGQDTLEGGSNGDSLDGGDGNDLLLGQNGPDTLSGGSGNDTAIGGNGDDLVLGDAGSDNLSGDGGLDTLDGGLGNDTIDGGSGNDVLNGGANNDSVTGGAGADTLNGDSGDDTLDGGFANDLIIGGSGSDILMGRSGDDTLDGGRGGGIDVATGGNGADCFLFEAEDDFLIITDFSFAQGDRIGLKGLDLADFGTWSITSTAGGTAALVDFSGLGEIQIDGVSPGQVLASWFKDADDPVNVDAIVWTGGGTIEIGTALAPTTFGVGINAAVPAGVEWSGLTLSDDWSQPGNWVGVATPTVAETAYFTGLDGGGTNVVDTDRTVAGLSYTSEAGHEMQVGATETLSVEGPAQIGSSNADSTGELSIEGGVDVNVEATQVYFGFNSTSGSVLGKGNVGSGSSLTVEQGSVNIGTVSGDFFTSGGASSEGSLTLASNSTLQVGDAASPAGSILIGFNGKNGTGTAVGALDASRASANVDIDVGTLHVGGLNGGTGTLRWNQTEVIHADQVLFGGRGDSLGILDTRAGETVTFGTASDGIDIFRIGYNHVAAGTSRADIDLSVENPFFEAYVDTLLEIGTVSGDFFTSGGASSEGSLTLASNSTLQVGDAASPAGSILIGFNGKNGTGTAVGVLDASDADATLDIGVTSMTVGGLNGGDGTFVIGSGVSLNAQNTTIGAGNGVGTVDFLGRRLDVGDAGALHTETLTLNGGLLTGRRMDIDAATGTFSWTDGTLSVNDIFGDVVQSGGTLDPHRYVGTTTINGDYSVASVGEVLIEIEGSATFDVLSVNGVVDINSDLGTGASLTLDLGFAATLGEEFVFLQNDGIDLASGFFDGLLQGDTLNASFAGSTYEFEIDYLAGDGNDISLTVTDIL